MTTRAEAAAEKRRRDDANLVEDVELMIAAKEWPERIATRLGYKGLERLARRLNDIGRQDLTLKMRLIDQTSKAFQVAHWTPMDEVVSRDKKAAKLKKKVAA